MTYDIRQGDALTLLRTLPTESVQMCVTSPPYYGLRSYKTELQVRGGDLTHEHFWQAQGALTKSGGSHGLDADCNENRKFTSSSSSCSCGAWCGELGLEPTPELFVQHLVEVFREVRRILHPSGTLWLNLGDSYAGSGRGKGSDHGKAVFTDDDIPPGNKPVPIGLKPKDLIGVPWRVAFALQQDGWWLRSDIIWAKPNPMPESVTDRPTRSHEYLFLLTKAANYYYDAEAIREVGSSFESDPRPPGVVRDREYDYNSKLKRTPRPAKQQGHSRRHAGFNDRWDAMKKADQCAGFRNKRDVWWLATGQFKDAHFAVFPEALVEPCIRAGSKIGDTVLDPFCGSGTTGVVALKLGRSFLGLELNQDYVTMAQRRIGAVMPLFA